MWWPGVLVEDGAQAGSKDRPSPGGALLWEDAVLFPLSPHAGWGGPVSGTGFLSSPPPSCWVTRGRSLAPRASVFTFPGGSCVRALGAPWELPSGTRWGLPGSRVRRSLGHCVTAAKPPGPPGRWPDHRHPPPPGNVAPTGVDDTKLWVGGKVPETKRLCHGGPKAGLLHAELRKLSFLRGTPALGRAHLHAMLGEAVTRSLLTGLRGGRAHSRALEKTGAPGASLSRVCPRRPEPRAFLSKWRLPLPPGLPESRGDTRHLVSPSAVPLESEREGGGFPVCSPWQSPGERSHSMDEQSEARGGRTCPRSTAGS